MRIATFLLYVLVCAYTAYIVVMSVVTLHGWKAALAVFVLPAVAGLILASMKEPLP